YDSPIAGYDGLVDMIFRLNEASFAEKRAVQMAARRTLVSLFPPGLPAAFAALFSKPMPAVSARMNAKVTQMLSEWLMGPSAVNDVEEIDG
ncbi:unnamed protein product, partial [Phaeothamnion confervicola]